MAAWRVHALRPECFAADLAAVLEHLSSRSIILVGHSFERTCASALYQRPD